jgi:hypothetical protein
MYNPENIVKSILFELFFHFNQNHQNTIAFVLLAYKFIKVSNHHTRIEKLKLLLFALFWFSYRNDAMIYGYLFSDYAYNAAVLGLFTRQLSLPLNLLLAIGMGMSKQEPDTKILDELNTFATNTLVAAMGIDVDNI